ncbi:MAG: glycosyl transferase family 4 [Candidatus ainarchaeum sp.]|nr:glycosyl transferase family 4 [Candidatus ainarchaeum sp.]
MFEIIPFLISLIFVVILFPPFIKRMYSQGFVGKDMNKYDKRSVAELGGVIVFLGFTLGLFSAIFLATYFGLFNIKLDFLLAGYSTIAIIVFVGLIDDIIGWKKGIKQWQHALFPILAALPLMAISIGKTSMSIPFFGLIDFGIFYSLLIIPIAITGASNAYNMLAGLNGLEAGQGIILTLTLTIIAFISSQTTAMILGIVMIGALCGFLLFNWFPAKIFGGDSLTLMVGANLAVMSILGNMQTFGAILFTIFFIEFLIKAKHKMKSECFGIPTKNGLLTANPKGGSITHFILKFKPMKEWHLTMTILFLQGIVCLTVLGIFFLI